MRFAVSVAFLTGSGWALGSDWAYYWRWAAERRCDEEVSPEGMSRRPNWVSKVVLPVVCELAELGYLQCRFCVWLDSSVRLWIDRVDPPPSVEAVRKTVPPCALKLDSTARVESGVY
jgi:hypothetical protein